ncbi:MAG: ATP-dependent sacrificial sulfur transferase LarE [Nitrospirae bacterium]|nr:MAG: ATP-dependent sacrificial sulfur transferase LarE [Nitrospirota bacterium]
MADLMEKYERLVDFITLKESVLVAFSGGVDSSLLVKAVKDSGINYLAITALSPTTPKADIEDVERLKETLKLNHRFIQTEEHRREEFRKNDAMRCFYCKDTLFSRLIDIAKKEGFNCVLEGTNLDDLNDYRPGLRASKRYGVISPLAEVGITKKDARELLKGFGIWLWNKPSSPCLSSRIAYGIPINEEVLERVEAAEEVLRGLGFREFRVRHHGDIARVELPEEDIERLCSGELRQKLVSRLLRLGYKFVTLDLEGLRSGKMNRLLDG